MVYCPDGFYSHICLWEDTVQSLPTSKTVTGLYWGGRQCDIVTGNTLHRLQHCAIVIKERNGDRVKLTFTHCGGIVGRNSEVRLVGIETYIRHSLCYICHQQVATVIGKHQFAILHIPDTHGLRVELSDTVLVKTYSKVWITEIYALQLVAHNSSAGSARLVETKPILGRIVRTTLYQDRCLCWDYALYLLQSETAFGHL